MNIEAIRATAAAGAATAATSTSVNYDAFLQMLIASMRNQDPTTPNDPAQMLSQLASFSVVEQGIKTNAKLDSLLAATAGAQAGTLIGKRIEVADGSASGIIESVEVYVDGLVAVTTEGVRIPIMPGVKISDP